MTTLPFTVAIVAVTTLTTFVIIFTMHRHHTHTHTHTRTHARTHARTHTRARTHTHFVADR